MMLAGYTNEEQKNTGITMYVVTFLYELDRAYGIWFKMAQIQY